MATGSGYLAASTGRFPTHPATRTDAKALEGVGAVDSARLGVDAMATEPVERGVGLADAPFDNDPLFRRLLPVAANLMQYRWYYAGASALLLVLMLLSPVSRSHHHLQSQQAASQASAPASSPAAAPAVPATADSAAVASAVPAATAPN